MNNVKTISSQAANKARTLLLFSLLVVAIVSLHSYHFQGRSYRQDEAATIYETIVNYNAAGGIGAALWQHISQAAAGQYLPLDIWIPLFGQAEPVVRFVATLWTALTLALIFRLAKDLFSASTGLLAVFILGTLAFFQFFSHEARPYPALVAGSTALLLIFERWLTRRKRIYLVLYPIVALVTLYFHVFIIYVIAAQAAYFVLFVRWNRRLWWQTIGMFIVTGMVLVPRLYLEFVVFKGNQGGINWYNLPTTLDSLSIVFEQMNIAPVPIGVLLLVVGLLVPVAVVFPKLAPVRADLLRFGREGRKIYLAAVPVIVLAIAFGVNLFVSNVTPRNLIIILPPFALLAAFGLRSLNGQARFAIVLLIAVPALTTFRSYISSGPYLEITSFIQQDFQPGDRFVVEAAQTWEHWPIEYYVRERLSQPVPNADLFHLLTISGFALDDLPDPPIYRASDDSSASLDAFRAFLGSAPRVWSIQNESVDFAAKYQAILNASYIPFRVQTWSNQQGFPWHSVTEYRRVPTELDDPFIFADNIGLRHWELKNDVVVRPCATVTLESWWSLRTPATENDSMTLVVVNANHEGIARSDGAPAGILTQLWQPEQLYLDSRSVTIPCDSAPGDYALILNLYNYETRKSLPITLNNGAPIDAAYLTTLHVVNP